MESSEESENHKELKESGNRHNGIEDYLELNDPKLPLYIHRILRYAHNNIIFLHYRSASKS